MKWRFAKHPDKQWRASAVGFYPVGISCRQVYFNLYEDEKGKRSYDEYIGREYDHIPEDADFAAKAKVEAWKHSKGPLPRWLYDPLEGFTMEAIGAVGIKGLIIEHGLKGHLIASKIANAKSLALTVFRLP